MIFLKKYKIKKIKNYNILYNRNSNIPKQFINLKFLIYKGNCFKKLKITKYYIGFKFGEFSFTRKPFKYPLIKKKR